MARTRKTPRRHYTGILAEPLLAGDLVGLAQRIDALFELHGLSRLQPDDHFKLILQLAGAHVPGFAIFNPSPGRSHVFSADEMLVIFVEVEKSREANPCLSVRAACDQLAYEPRWKNYKGKTISAEQIRTAYKAVKTAARNFAQGTATFQQIFVLSLQWGDIYRKLGGDPHAVNPILAKYWLAKRRNQAILRRRQALR